jgi:polyphosphate kinase
VFEVPSPWADRPGSPPRSPLALARALRDWAEPVVRALQTSRPPDLDAVMARTVRGLSLPGARPWWTDAEDDTGPADGDGSRAEAADGAIAEIDAADADADADAALVGDVHDGEDPEPPARPLAAGVVAASHGPMVTLPVLPDFDPLDLPHEPVAPRPLAPRLSGTELRPLPLGWPSTMGLGDPTRTVPGASAGLRSIEHRRGRPPFTRSSRRGHLRPPRATEPLATLASMTTLAETAPGGERDDELGDASDALLVVADEATAVVGWSSPPIGNDGDGDPDAMAESPERFLNREQSWLAFNARVLALAEDPATPVLERIKFLAIFSQNLDEFFQVRVAGLKDQLAAGLAAPSPDGRTPAQQLSELRERVAELVHRQERLFLDQVTPDLSEVGIILSSWRELDEDDTRYLDEVFAERIFPVLTPLAVDPGHPFPYISDLSLNLAVVVHDPIEQARRFARVKVPLLLPRFVVMPDGERYVPLEEVIARHLGTLFPGLEIEDHFAFRVTRNADLTLEEEEADDLLEAVEMELRRRRFGRAVRLELDIDTTDEVRELLTRELDIEDDDIYLYSGPLDLGGLWSVHGLDRPDLKDPVWVPVTATRLAGDDDEPVNFFRVLRKHDVLVHHPYTSFATSIEEFIHQASVDPKVLAIKLTLYRTSGDSSIIRSLTRAVERGKQVAALVELKARFDEQANIEWARRLEKAGVHVIYGLAGLKVHTKTLLVVRDEGDVMRRYCHVGTGNYNPKTARLYEDIGLLTSDPEVGADLTQLFNFLTGYGRDMQFRKLLVSPQHVRPRLSELIRGEIAAGEGVGRIVMKMNSLVDPGLIDLLYQASQAGVSIDLVVRGICCLRPGIAGLSDNIRVRSIVGRYLEHSRIYHFAHGAQDGGPVYYIGSADLMPRNLDRRVEALAPVEDPDLQERLAEILDVNLDDDTLAWELHADGVWHHVERVGQVDTHLTLQEAARSRRPVGPA